MKLYKVVSGVLVIGAGQHILLTKEQASPRTHKLKPLDNEWPGQFEAIEPLQFIVGEELGVAGLLPVQEPFVDFTDAQKEANAAEAAAAEKAAGAKKETKAEKKRREAEEAEWTKVYQDDPALWEKFATVELYIEDRRKQSTLV